MVVEDDTGPRVGRVQMIDPLKEFVEVQLYGTYSQKGEFSKLRWFPAWVDDRNRLLYAAKAPRKHKPWLMTCYQEDILSQPFTLRRARSRCSGCSVPSLPP